MAQSPVKRKYLLLRPKIQLVLLARIGFYWAVYIVILNLLRILLAGPLDVLFGVTDIGRLSLAAQLFATALLAPLVVCDVIRFSNRFVGPIYRLHRELQRLAAGEPIHPLRFREGDYWQEVADAINAVSARLSTECSSTTSSQPLASSPRPANQSETTPAVGDPPEPVVSTAASP